jgi:hypothetical protein
MFASFLVGGVEPGSASVGGRSQERGVALAVQGLGQTRPSKLEICRQRDRRTPTAKRAARLAYQRSLQALLERRFSAYQASRLTTCVDLERSFGLIYARGLLRRGQSGFAVLGVKRARDPVFD